ncbi:hypothetical protein [Dokdonella koreensis]|uniref:Intradiol ring-cleavage dioxygenase n=1 Tax=Dokdonella koreensis DS-123 TaxID=1300342 RepID=A0A160DW28_9GAMM|nr:hypothetical protein [Dokdonella koreensis]ANB18420.1 Intradiol ring-cleavage dioxygenase [Dokdonella koreensis DS-123]
MSFLTVYPVRYGGRIMHIHFQVCLDDGGTLATTAQRAVPRTVAQAVSASPLSVAHRQNPTIDFSQGNVFADGIEQRPITIAGDVAGGHDATWRVAIAG